MPSNTRGKIKEHLEGVHRNTEGIKSHISTILVLVGDKNEGVKFAMRALADLNTMLDESAQKIHGLI